MTDEGFTAALFIYLSHALMLKSLTILHILKKNEEKTNLPLKNQSTVCPFLSFRPSLSTVLTVHDIPLICLMKI